MEEIYKQLLTKIDSKQVYLNEPMSKHTSFKIGGPADIFVKPKNIEELKYIIEIAKQKNIPITIIGNGSNLLVKDRRNKGYSCKARI